MKYRLLGRTGLEVSVIGFGTTELGMDYGIKVPGEYGKPDRETAKRIIYKALDSGINLFDTAPGYGNSEVLLGSVVSPKGSYVATKISIVNDDKLTAKAVRGSIERSLKSLKREHLDLVQIHSATIDMIENSEIIDILSNLRKEGLIRFIGVSVYDPKDAMAVIKKDFFDVLQIAYNILDQRMLKDIVSEAKKDKIGIISRSAYFRGMLTKKIEYLDSDWNFLKEAVYKIRNKMSINDWADLSKLALKFCLSTKGIASVLVGIRTMEELDFAVKTEKENELPDNIREDLLALEIKDDYWVNPLNWYLKL